MPLPTFLEQKLGADFLPRLKREVVGLAQDFWKDGPNNLLKFDFSHTKRSRQSAAHAAAPHAAAQPSSSKSAASAAVTSEPSLPLWHAEPGEISEKMWGDGFVTPGGIMINAKLISPLGLTKEMSVLDLSAGLGGRMRRTAEETGAYITGLEPDAAIAARGMQLSVKAGKAKHAAISHYDPADLSKSLNRSYDCIIARETFYRVPDKPTFFTAVAKHTKPRGQITFTDYLLDPEHRDNPVAAAWKKQEPLASPLGLVEMVEAWGKVGFDLRVHEDLTDFYKTEVLIGLKKFSQFLASGSMKPDEETRLAIVKRLATWQCRVAAMGAGMKFYRFYGTKT